MQRRRLLVIGIALLLSIVAFIGTTALVRQPEALAHAFVIGSDPVDSSTINKVPKEVHIFFNSAISPLSTAYVYSIQSGNMVGVNAAPGRLAPGNTRELVVPIAKPDTQPQGSYEVMWTAVANDDGHTTYGIIGFDVGFSGTGLSGTPLLGPISSNKLDDIRTLSPTALLSVGWDWLVFAALTLWVGILVMERLVLPRTERGAELLTRARKQTYSTESLCLITLILAELVTLMLRVLRLVDARNSPFDASLLLGFLTQTNYGLLWLMRMILLVVALGFLYWTNWQQQQKVALSSDSVQRKTLSGSLRQSVTEDISAGQSTTTKHVTKEQLELDEATTMQPQPQSYRVLWLLIAGLILFTQALSSNAAQILQPHFSAIVLDWLNLAAQGIWFGSLAYLGYALLPLLAKSELDHNAELLVAVLRRTTPFLLAGMGIFLVSDLFLSEASIGNAQQLLTDPYGITLVMQNLAIGATVILSLYTICALRPRITRQALLLPVVNAELPTRRSRQSTLSQMRRQVKQAVNLQLWLALAVLLGAALLSFFAPPIIFPDIHYANPTTEQTNGPTNTQTRQIGDLSVTLLITPGRVGSPNTVTLTINNSAGKAVTDAQVQLTTNMQAMDMGIGHATMKGGNPTYSTTFEQQTAFNMSGLWIINVQIERPGQAPVTGAFQMMITA